MPGKNQPFYTRFVKEELYDREGNLVRIAFDVPENFNFAFDVVDQIAAEEPDRLAILWVNDKGSEKRVTFAQLKEESDKAASFFRSLGIGRGDSVILLLRSYCEYWYSYLALHKLGAVAIPATTTLQVKDMSYRIKAADIKAAVCIPGAITETVELSERECGRELIKVIVDGERAGWHNFGKGLENAAPFTRPTGKDAPVSTDMALLFFTSGTTGMPKMVPHDQFYAIGNITAAVHWQNLRDGDLFYTHADTAWGKTAWSKMYAQWMSGAAQFIYDHDLRKFTAAALLRLIEKYKITVFCAPPTIYRMFIKEDLKSYDLSSLRYTATAGEACNPKIYEDFMAACGGIPLKEAFGQTETIPICFNQRGMEIKPGSMGRPNPYWDVDIVDDEGHSVDAGINGEIVIRVELDKRPYGFFMGYYKDDAINAEVFRDGLYHTGDVAWKDEDGYYWFVGRKDDIIKSSGYRIGPFEVESVIIEHPAVMDCAVTGVPDEIRGQIVKATIVLSKGYSPSQALASEIQTYVKNHTAPYKYPRVIEFVDSLPMTISNKIIRRELRKGSAE